MDSADFLKSDVDDLKITLTNSNQEIGSLTNPENQQQSKDEKIIQLELQLQEKV